MKPLRRALVNRSMLSSSPRAIGRTLTTPRQHAAPLSCVCAQVKPTISRSILQLSTRRSFADIAPPKVKRRRTSLLRWTWRLTYLSAIGGLVYMGYGIYLLRTPLEQLEPDPTKKNLVILGMSSRVLFRWLPLTFLRYRLGRCISSQETRNRELQCHRHLSSKLLPLHPIVTIMHDRHNRAPIYYGAYTKYPTT